MVLTPGQIISNRYEIIEKIGSGGMSLVYRARDRKLDRYVTFKVMREEHLTDEEFQARFKIEAQAVASLSHPNIVNVYDVGQENDINYIVMEYIDGLTLKELITKKAPFSNDEILGVAIQITDALAHAHHHGIVHRDIKPQNILVTKAGAIKVTDFGIARTVTSDTVSVGNTTMGSVHYFSPEQARGGFVDAKSDLYSLGILMYEMGTGELPFDGESSVAVALMQINEPLPDIRAINPNISEAVENIITRLTDKKPFNRFQSDEELSAVLKGAIVDSGAIPETDRRINRSSQTIQFTGEEYESLQSESGRRNHKAWKDNNGEPPERSGRTDEIKVIIAAVLAALAIIIIAGSVIWPRIRKDLPPELVAVPDFVGKDFDAASAEARLANLSLEINEETYNNQYAVGQIFYQNYEPDGMVDPGQVILVDVSLGEKLVEVPDLVKKEGMDAANEVLNSSSFRLSQKDIYDDNMPKGYVVRQTPEAGDHVPPGTELTIYVSKGPEIKTVIVPDLANLTEEKAKLKLIEFKLTIGNITPLNSDSIDKGKVMTQTVKAGSEVQEGTVVGIAVSLGPASTPPPTVTAEAPGPSSQPSPGNNPSSTAGTTAPPAQSDIKTKNLLIEDVNFPSGVDTVEVKVLKTTSNGPVQVYSGTHSTGDFPLSVPVSGTGTVRLTVMVNGIEHASGNMNFNE